MNPPGPRAVEQRVDEREVEIVAAALDVDVALDRHAKQRQVAKEADSEDNQPDDQEQKPTTEA